MMRLRSVVGGRGWKSGIFSFCRSWRIGEGDGMICCEVER